MKILITGGAGFIGSALIRHLIAHSDHAVVNVDALTYAASPEALAGVADHPRYAFEHADIREREPMDAIFADHRPDGVIHLAAESHVDRSIDAPEAFVATNVNGTLSLLQAAAGHYQQLTGPARDRFRFHHVSTDEVFGTLGDSGQFSETSPYAPNSPYSASKAASDHLVRAWQHTYGLPTVVTNCSNNYGPYQFPEKLIPLMILNALQGRPLPVYGDGQNVRDWLFVDDHARALRRVFEAGRIGAQYNIGGHTERSNLDLVRTLCAELDALAPDPVVGPRAQLITFVADRAGHDRRYAIDATKIQNELGWTPSESLDSGLRRTLRWYLAHPDWCEAIRASGYDGQRLGTNTGAPA